MAEISLLHVCVRLLLYILHDNSCCAIVIAEQSYIRYTSTKDAASFPRPLRTHLLAATVAYPPRRRDRCVPTSSPRPLRTHLVAATVAYPPHHRDGCVPTSSPRPLRTHLVAATVAYPPRRRDRCVPTSSPRPLRTHLVTVDLIPVADVVDVVIIVVVAQVAVVDETDIVDAHVVDGDEDAGVIGSFAVQPFLPFRSVQVALHPQPRLLPAGGDTVRLWQRN